jgi:hypothetical protein
MLLNIHTCCVGNYINVYSLSGGMKRWVNWVLGGLGWEEGGLVLSGFSTGRVGIKAVATLKAYPVFEPFLCLGGVLRFFVCEGGQVRLLVFGSVQVGEGFSCLCL